MIRADAEPRSTAPGFAAISIGDLCDQERPVKKAEEHAGGTAMQVRSKHMALVAQMRIELAGAGADPRVL